MSEYASTVYGVIEYNIISPETQLAIANFIGNRNILDEHISRKCDRTAAYSLPSAYVNNLGIEFTPLTGQFLDVKESLDVVVSFLRAVDVQGIKVDIIQVGSNGNLDEIEHFKIDNNYKILSSPATVTFNHYQ